MLYPLSTFLNDARASSYAVPAFNFDSFDTLFAIFKGATSANAPLIVQITEPAIEGLGIENVVSIVKNQSSILNIPTCLHLDHGENIEIIRKCTKAGFSSVMFDGSSLPYEENVQLTKECARIAKESGASLEAEIGHVGTSTPGASSDVGVQTDIKEAVDFYKETGVDALAISVGTAHGMHNRTANIDLDKLRAISLQIPAPLVLHGTSGLSDNDLKSCLLYGVAKTNVETELRRTYRSSLEKVLNDNPDLIKPRHIMKPVQEAIAEKVYARLEVLQCCGKAARYR